MASPADSKSRPTPAVVLQAAVVNSANNPNTIVVFLSIFASNLVKVEPETLAKRFGSVIIFDKVVEMDKLLKRLAHYVDLSPVEISEIESLPIRNVSYRRGEDIIQAGDPTKEAFVLCAGWAVRYTLLEDGRRQILNVLLPGDLFDLQVLVAKEADHSVMAATDTDLCIIKPPEFARLFHRSGRLGLAFWWAAVQEEAILREQIVRNGRRSGKERLVHFLLEVHRRARVVGEADDNMFELPLNQTHIADALGLTTVYTNRIMRTLIRDGLITKEASRLYLTDIAKLIDISDFDAGYLHLSENRRLLSDLLTKG